MRMHAPAEAEILALWERGVTRHPIDRALLLCAWARPDMPAALVPDLPLGTLNRSLLRMRESCFGARISACVDCEQCGERMELTLDTEKLLATDSADEACAEFEISGLRFRVPCSRDLAAIAGERDIKAATRTLLQRCCIARAAADDLTLDGLLNEADAAMENIDPAADINLAVRCEVCGHEWLAQLDIGALIWDEIDARARGLLGEVHCLASAYGWSETQILALSPQRRAAYLDRVAP